MIGILRLALATAGAGFFISAGGQLNDDQLIPRGVSQLAYGVALALLAYGVEGLRSQTSATAAVDTDPVVKGAAPVDDP